MSNYKLAKDRKKVAAARGKRTEGEYKQFSQKSYSQHNAPGIWAVLQHLDSLGIYAKENDDLYGPDIVVWSGFQPAYYIEVAQRSAWHSGEWPEHWDPVRIEERKLHLFQSLALPCSYWIVSGDAKVYLSISDVVISKYAGELVEVSNSMVPEGEKFICIPLTETAQGGLNNG